MFTFSDEGAWIYLDESVDFFFEGSSARVTVQVEATERSFSGLVVSFSVVVIESFIVEESIPSLFSEETIDVEDFQGDKSVHSSVSGGRGHIRVEVVVDEVFPFVLNSDGVDQKTVFTLFFNVVGDEETSDGSLDLVETSSTSLEHQVLIRMAGLSDDVLVKIISSEFSILVDEEIFHGKTLVDGNVSGPLPEDPGHDALNRSEKLGSNAFGIVVVGSNLDFSMSIGSEPLFGGADNSFTAKSLGVDEGFPEELLKSNHFSCLDRKSVV